MDRETTLALQSFREELDDRLYKLRPLIMSMPENAMVSTPEAIHDAFRQLHSLKGAANLLNLRPIGELAHKLEDVLAKVRTEEIPFDRTVRDIIIIGLERIEEIGEDLRKVRLLDVSRELAQIDAIMQKRQSR